ncbi:hypothetical protein PUR49_07280 [Streptomyces sp. BE147]|uniref:hypothetical protein n=1 Tax=Streptomyces sp. BE147 TaxID=3002524 RepID=UPI002E79B2A6|nr:hypothetical protein [Streptomyces sp. BE147]MEE1736304.1 hypothetical protein [Streptomyces sp. BE147]
MPDEHENPAELVRARYALYVESLRARMPQEQFALLMEIVRLWVRGGGGTARLELDGPERELFTSEVQQEFLNLMGLIGAMQPGHEDRADHVVARLGDGEHTRGAMSLVPPDVAADPEKLRAMRDRIDAEQGQRTRDQRTVEEIARASGMSTSDTPDPSDAPDPSDTSGPTQAEDG